MKKFINDADTMVSESLAGFVAAHEDLVVFGPDRKCIRRHTLVPGKVALVSGGGAGHEPMHIGFVGHGMLDAACTGHIFSSPTPEQIMTAITAADTGAGCLLIVKNYDGDVMNFEIAAEMLAGRHAIETVIVGDDTDPCGSPRSRGRRGMAGTLVVEKILGAAAEEGMALPDLKALGDRLCGTIRSMGVALGSVTVPATRRATFQLGPDEMEMGVGIHGEPGRAREALASADRIAEHLCTSILADLSPVRGQSGLLFVNGFGGTPAGELYLLYHAARPLIGKAGVEIIRSLTGNYVTSLDMAGASVTLALLDETTLRLWDAPVRTAALRWRL